MPSGFPLTRCDCRCRPSVRRRRRTWRFLPSTAIAPRGPPRSSSPCFRLPCWRRSVCVDCTCSLPWGSSPGGWHAHGWPSVLDPRRNAALARRCGGRRHAVSLLWARVPGSTRWRSPLVWPGRRSCWTRRAADRAGTPTPATAFAAGLLMGAAIVLRPERPALQLRCCWPRGRWSTGQPGARWPSPLAASAPHCSRWRSMQIVHFGSFVPGHISANAGLVDGLWPAERLRLAADWLLPSGCNTAGQLRNQFLERSSSRRRRSCGSCARTDRKERPFLASVAIVTTLLVVLAAPNDGGGQWGPATCCLPTSRSCAAGS